MHGQQHFQHAQILYQQKRYAQAVEKLRLALLDAPDTPDYLSLLGKSLVEVNDPQALEFAQQAVSLDPEEVQWQIALAQVHLRRLEYRRALQVLEQAAQLAPEHFSILYLQGFAHYQLNDYRRAKQALELALAQEPDHTAAKALYAEVLRITGQTTQAAAVLQQNLAEDPEDAQSHSILGWNYLQHGQRDLAKQHFMEALRLEPGLRSASEGVLATLRAINPVYRIVLSFFFWMARFPPKYQLGIMLGGFFGIRAIIQAREQFPAWNWLWISIIVLYASFVYCTWFATPLMNVCLLFHPFGRHAIQPYERRAAILIAAGIAVLLVLLIHDFIFADVASRWVGALFWGSFCITLTVVLSREYEWGGRWLYAYTIVLGICVTYFVSRILLEYWLNIPFLALVFVGWELTLFNFFMNWIRYNILISSLLFQFIPTKRVRD